MIFHAARAGASFSANLLRSAALAVALMGSVMYVVHTIKRSGAVEHSYHQAKDANKKLAADLKRMKTINKQHDRNARRASEQIETAATAATANKTLIEDMAPDGADQICPVDCLLP